MKKGFTLIMVIISLLGCIILSGCDVDSGYSARDLQDAKGRYFSGTASKSDKRMVEGFYKWKANQ